MTGKQEFSKNFPKKSEKNSQISEKSPDFSEKTDLKKPTINEVIAYSKPLIMKFINQYASSLPREHKEEIEQTAYLRIIKAYEGLKADGGWKSFVYNHSRGAVLDYLKFGVGFQEDKWTIAKDEEHGSRNVHKIRERIHLSFDDNDFTIDQVLGQEGIYNELNLDEVRIRWDLVARLARVDDQLHAFALWIRGYHIEQIGPVFHLSRARIGQLIESFIARFKNPTPNDYWFRQICYALGICEMLDIKDVDQSANYECKLGWNYEPVDLDSLKPKYKSRSSKWVQLELF